MPNPALQTLQLIGLAGLVLFLVGVAHEINAPRTTGWFRTVNFVGFGSFVPALLTGAGFAAWIWISGKTGGQIVGAAPFASFVLVLAVCFAVTAVPVLARILVEHGLMSTPVGQLAIAAAAGIDAVGWILLSVAIGLASGGFGGAIIAVCLLLAGCTSAVLLRRGLSIGAMQCVSDRSPRWTAVAIGLITLTFAWSLEHYGLTAVVGAVLAGLAIPRRGGSGWESAVHHVRRLGNLLTPVSFVATGIAVLTSPAANPGWLVIVLTCVLASLAKMIGTYLGARLSGEPHWFAVRLGVLMNAKGMTEFVFLQAAYHAGILTPAMFLALAVMAVTTTAITGPLLSLISFLETRRGALP